MKDAQIRKLQEKLDGDVDVESTWSSFVEDTLDLTTQPAPGVSHVDHFLRYLVDRGAISEEKYVELNASQETAPSFDAPLQELLGSKRYQPLRMLAEGGMGQIWIARDTRLQRNVAFKMLRVESARYPILVERFLHEAQVTARLDHPSVVPVYSIEAEGETVAFAMKLVQGKTLEELIQEAREHVLENPKEPFPEGLAEEHRLDVFTRICEAVAYAHSHKVLHRDLKPANVMVGEFGEVYVMDWGIADIQEQERDEEATRGRHDEASSETEIEAETRTEAEPQAKTKGEEDVVAAPQHKSDAPLSGTPLYMSPEQARGGSVETASDIFTLGLILFELVALRRARNVDNSAEAVADAMHATVQPIRHASPQHVVMPPLRAIVGRATAANPEDRYATVEALAEDVRRYLRRDKVLAFSENPVQRAARWMTVNKQKTLLALLLIVATAATATIWALWAEQKTAERARQQEKALNAEAERREERLAELLQEINRTTSSLDHEISSIEGLTRALDAAVQTTLEMPATVPNGPLFFEEDYPEVAPPDLGPSKRYQTDTSVDWPLYNVAPDVDRESVLPLAWQLNRLRGFYRQLLLDSADGEGTGHHAQNDDPSDAAALLRDEGVPLVYAAIGLQAGLYVVFPALPGAVPDEYDPRKRPWYRLAANKQGLHWGEPYIDAAGNRLLLPCSRAIFNEDDDFVGVASLSVEVDTLLARLEPSDLPAGAEGFLIDSRGLVIGRSSGKERVYASGMHNNKAMELEPFPWPEALKTIRKQNAGVLELENGQLTALFGSLQTVDWAFVVVGPDEELIGGTR